MIIEDEIQAICQQRDEATKEIINLTKTATYPLDKSTKRAMAELKQRISFLNDAYNILLSTNVTAVKNNTTTTTTNTNLPMAVEKFEQTNPITPQLQQPIMSSRQVSIPSNLPEFRTGSTISTGNPELFLERLQLRLRAAKIPTEDWRNILPICTNDLVASWIETYIPVASSWLETKEAFLKHYNDPNILIQKRQQLYDMQKKANESITNFVDRFSVLCQAVGNPNEYIDLLVTKLPPNLQMKARERQLMSQFDSLDQLCTYANSLSLIEEKSRPSSGTNIASHNDSQSTTNSATILRQPVRPRINSSLTCEHCQRKGHLKDDCFFLHPEKIPRVQFVSNDNLPKSLIEVTVCVNSHNAKSIIDSGATISVLSKSFCESKAIEIVPQKGTIKLASKESSFPRYGTTVPITVEFNGKQCTHVFEVFETSDIDLLFGLDLFEVFGISITGIDVENKEELSEINTEDELETWHFIGDEQKESAFKELIAGELTANAAIPLKQFCTHPLAVVELNTGDSAPVYRKQHPQVPIVLNSFVTEKVTEWFESGKIEECPGSPYHTPLLVAQKMVDGVPKLARLCTDQRGLNTQLPDVNYPLPNIKELFQNLAHSKYFTKLDLKESFLQFPLKEEHRFKTAFSWNDKLYQFVGTPFGLKHISFIFQRVISDILKKFPFALCYIDDIVVFSNSVEEHVEHVKQVLQELTRYSLKLKIEKCSFCSEKISLLGHIISHAGIQIDSEKCMQAINWNRPETGNQMQSFLGLTNYFRDFIPNYAHITAPLDDLRKVDVISDELWTEKHETAFTNLKKSLLAAPILSYPDYSKPFSIASDASNNGIGAMLFQEYDGTKKYVAFVSRSLSVSEKKYTTPKKELLAIVFAMKKFHPFIWGSKFILYCDNKSLSFILTQKIASQCYVNWIETLANYNYVLHHISGVNNFIPDSLSRLYCAEEISNPVESDNVRVVNQTSIASETELDGNKRKLLIETTHLLGHYGSEKMILKLRSLGFDWKTMETECREYAQTCHTCQMHSNPETFYQPPVQIVASNSFDHVQVDLMGPFTKTVDDNEYCLVLVDVHTRFTIIRPLKTKEAGEVAQCLFGIFCEWGFPKVMQTDHGNEFDNLVLENICKFASIDKRLIAYYNPKANGMVERVIGNAKKVLSKVLESRVLDWDKEISFVQYAINSSIHDVHKISPFHALFGKDSNSLVDFSNEMLTCDSNSEQFVEKIETIRKIVSGHIQNEVVETNSKRKEQFIKSHKIIKEQFAIGSLVMIRKQKQFRRNFTPPNDGPFIIHEISKANTYILKDGNGIIFDHKYPVSQLIPYCASNERQDELSSPAFIVERILDHRGPANAREYLVKWLYYDESYNSWEPFGNFCDTEIVSNYWKVKNENSVAGEC